ncbi:AAA family ATPase [Bifidobacterium aerophilum]|nr:AAA family ATPase [Bifidobacterium aerophilum]
MGNMMRLERLSVTNYRKFGGKPSSDDVGQDSDEPGVPGLSVDFDESMTVLVGANGAGKTSVLDAIAVALGPFLAKFPDVNGPNITSYDAYRSRVAESGESDIQPHYPVVIGAKATIAPPTSWKTYQENGEPSAPECEWKRTLNSAEGRTTSAKARELSKLSADYQWQTQNDPYTMLPVLAYYGTDRLGLREKSQWKTHSKKFKNRYEGYNECLNPHLNFKQLDAWWRKQYDRDRRGLDVPTFHAVRDTVAECLERFTGNACVKIDYDYTDGLVVSYADSDGVYFENQRFGDLSDGYRVAVGLVADIAWRIAALNPFMGYDVVKKTSGIVLVDEVDLHLHPVWQEKILGILRELFPCVQFIVATHAPMVISSVKAKNLRVLGKVSEKQSPAPGVEGLYFAKEPDDETYGSSAGVVLQHVMGSGDRPTAIQKLYDLFGRQLDQDDYAGAKKTLAKLENTIGSGNPDLSAAQSAYFFYAGEVND